MTTPSPCLSLSPSPSTDTGRGDGCFSPAARVLTRARAWAGWVLWEAGGEKCKDDSRNTSPQPLGCGDGWLSPGEPARGTEDSGGAHRAVRSEASSPLHRPQWRWCPQQSASGKTGQHRREWWPELCRKETFPSFQITEEVVVFLRKWSMNLTIKNKQKSLYHRKYSKVRGGWGEID